MARVLMFGALQDLAGWRERNIEAVSLSGLKDLITGEHALLGERLSGPGVFAIVNQDLVRGDMALTCGDEVAFVPPVSGG